MSTSNNGHSERYNNHGKGYATVFVIAFLFCFLKGGIYFSLLLVIGCIIGMCADHKEDVECANARCEEAHKIVDRVSSSWHFKTCPSANDINRLLGGMRCLGGNKGLWYDNVAHKGFESPVTDEEIVIAALNYVPEYTRRYLAVKGLKFNERTMKLEPLGHREPLDYYLDYHYSEMKRKYNAMYYKADIVDIDTLESIPKRNY